MQILSYRLLFNILKFYFCIDVNQDGSLVRIHIILVAMGKSTFDF